MTDLTFEIISFGNELLIGEIVNTNSQWLARQITILGGKVRRIVSVSDDPQDISSAFIETINRNPAPNIIISTGGLGPTWDDGTSNGLGIAVKDKIAINDTAMNMIKERYKEMNISMSKGSIQMAEMPTKAIPLLNPAGTAPGIKYNLPNSIIFCLPGVPKEMKEIFRMHIIPEIREKNPDLEFFESKFYVTGSYESKIAVITSEFLSKFPSVYIKSHPEEQVIKLHLTTYGGKKEQRQLNKATSELMNEISKIGAILEN